MYFYNMALTITTEQTITQLPAPRNLRLNDEPSGFSGLQRDVGLTLSWDASGSEGVAGYEVWRCLYPSTAYQRYATTTGRTYCTVFTGSKGYMAHTYVVKAIADSSGLYTDSDFSEESIIAMTKFTNVHYYHDGRWLLGEVSYYDGSAWKQEGGLKYYDGSAWKLPGF